MIHVRISSDALDDLGDGFRFYEAQEKGLGDYFLSQLRADIDGLTITAGIHRKADRHLHRLLSKRFPYAVFYEFVNSYVLVVAVIDCRRELDWIAKHLDR
jgi:plasmid stabilization system protein ParE